MSLDPKHIQQLSSRLERLCEQTSRNPEVEAVHHLRTNSRRLEALLKSQSVPMNRNHQKLLALLREVRRGAGKIRDLDVQIAALEGLHSGPATQKQQLLLRLHKKRVRQAGKFRQQLDRATVKKLQRRVTWVTEHLLLLDSRKPTQSAEGAVQHTIADTLRRFSKMEWPPDSLTDRELHAWRIECKRLRYRLEAAGDDRQVSDLVRLLKRIQDGVGKWHDWLTLTQNAEKLLPRKQSADLVRLLRRTTRRRRGQALRVIASVREQMNVAFPPSGRGAAVRPVRMHCAARMTA